MHDEHRDAPRQILLRGVLVGGALGMIARWFGYEPAKAFFLAVICGLLAAGTRIALLRRRKK
ncbi:MAG: hypothetical protein JG774_524 [Desulfomicrobiaceae bacterium]|jgi:hypothetical protein|nr:hypothetical protein [Desulfomicrobiaceae bacterium]MBZ4648603.1 hypothetical protein [Desulfomicrobiaceae bacterium]MBZ4684779.1 hypothetical protein [Desulfomicrobiaceae bacterium]MDI3492890.1 hypothetical protein [Desulfomicrobiaceae bacterium]MDK2872428.1 hypothetical protein [Desulfomicrobiaceae bacterium]